MPRPAKPLIQYDAVIQTSLRIIDEEGLDAFSLPRLSRELNVRAPSLYHHFADKAEILRGIARVIVLQARLPGHEQAPNWIEWFVQVSLSFRASVLKHRNAAPILLQFMPRDVLVRTYDASAQILAELGVPAGQQVLILDGLDRLTLGATITEAVRDVAEGAQAFDNARPETEPTLSAAVAANELDSAQLFAETIRSFLRGVASYVPADAPAPVPPAGFVTAEE